MKVALLQCDDVRENFLPQFGNYPEMISRLVHRSYPDAVIDVFDCRDQHYPEQIDDYDFYISTGSRHSVYEPLPWIEPLIKFVQNLDRQNKKMFGICFGHQIIARALQQPVQKSPKGWGIGIAQNRVAAKPAWMTESRSTLGILVSHQDQVMTIPKSATVIAESDFCPYFMVQWNDNLLSIQGHPEWQNDYAAALIHDRRSIIPAERVNAGLFSLRLKPDNDLFAGWIRDFVSAE